MVTKLAIKDIDTGDSRFLRIIDNSFYNPDITVENAILEITVPGGTCPVYFNTTREFNTVFNSSTLGILPTNSYNGLVGLPDGVYKIKYSIKPNNIIYQEFDHMRISGQLNLYYNTLCSLFIERSNISKKEFEHRLKQLNWIKQLLETSKHEVENLDNITHGLELYNEAKDLLNKMC